MNELKNIVVVNDFNYINGGAAKVAIDTAKVFKDNPDINVYFFSAVNNVKENQKIEKINYINTNQYESLKDPNKVRGALNGIWNIKAKNEFKNLLKQLDKNNTIIHIHGWIKALSSSVFYIAYKNKFKIVITQHDYFFACPNGGFYNYKKEEICKLKPMGISCVKCNCDSRNYFYKIYRIIRQFVQNNIVKMNKKIKYIISISDFSIDKLSNSFNKDVIIKKIHNPIDSVDSKIESICKNNYYLYVGRLSKEKGANIFCEAITNLGYKGIVVGEGEEKKTLQKKYSSIEFVGWKSTYEVKTYMKNARALIFPSLWYEGAPLTILEALSMGLPCIVSNECAAIEFIEEDITGLKFERNSVEDLSIKIKNLENSQYLQMLSENAYNSYWKNPYDINSYQRELEEFYIKVLNDDINK